MNCGNLARSEVEFDCRINPALYGLSVNGFSTRVSVRLDDEIPVTGRENNREMAHVFGLRICELEDRRVSAIEPPKGPRIAVKDIPECARVDDGVAGFETLAIHDHLAVA